MLSPLLFIGGREEPEIDPSNLYGYIPSRTGTIAFMVLFMLSALIHMLQAGRYKQWWPLPTMVLCGVLETIGWGARFYSSFEPNLRMPYIVQTVGTLIAPTPLIAGDFILLATLIRILGPKYSRLRPKMYSIIFLTCDIVSLVVQTIGGGLAASADSLDGAETGTKIAFYGVIFQLVAVTCYVVLAIEFLVLYSKDKPFLKRRVMDAKRDAQYFRGTMTTKRLAMVIGLFLNVTCLYIRSLYRVAELAEGFGGEIIRTQVYFVVLDGQMIVIAMFILNIAHPGWLLDEEVTSETQKPWHLGENYEGIGLVQRNADTVTA